MWRLKFNAYQIINELIILIEIIFNIFWAYPLDVTEELAEQNKRCPNFKNLPKPLSWSRFLK
jgi:hypothetical protein